MERSDVVVKFEDSLVRAQFATKQTPTRILCERKVEPIMLSKGLWVGPFFEGKRYAVPLWLATTLVKHRCAVIEETDCEFPRLQKITNEELANLNIGELADDELLKFSIWDSFLDSLAKAGLVPVQNAEKYHQFLIDLVKLRAGKLLKLAVNAPTEELFRKLSSTERELLARLSRLVRSWRDLVLG